MNQRDEITMFARRQAKHTIRNNFFLLFAGGLTGALLVLALTETRATRWAGAALPALLGVWFFLAGYYNKKATGKTGGMIAGCLAAISAALLSASELVTTPSVRLALSIIAAILMIAFAVLSWRVMLKKT